MITAIFRAGPLDGRAVQLRSAPRELFISAIAEVRDGAIDEQVQLEGGYVMVDGTEVSFIRRSNAIGPSGEQVFIGSSTVLDGVVYEWNDELNPAELTGLFLEEAD